MPIDVNLFGNERVRQASSSFTAIGPNGVPIDSRRESSLSTQRDMGASVAARGQNGFLTGSINQSAFSEAVNSGGGFSNVVTGVLDSVSVNAGGAFKIGSNAVVNVPGIGFGSSSTRIDNTVMASRVEGAPLGNRYEQPPLPRAIGGGQAANAPRNSEPIDGGRSSQGQAADVRRPDRDANYIKQFPRNTSDSAKLMSIDALLSAFGEDGPAKSNKFRVEFNLPTGINADPTTLHVNTDSTRAAIGRFGTTVNAGGRVNIMCHTCTLPSRELQSFELKQYGTPHAMPFTASYMPISFGFYSDTTLSARTFFETWQSAITNIGTNTFNFYNEYTSDIRIYILDSEGNETYYVDVYECWPTSLMQADYSYSSNDTIQTFMVAMRYKYWQSSENDTEISRAV